MRPEPGSAGEPAGAGGGEGPPPALGPFLLACGAAALWIDLGAIHRLHHGDSLLPVLVSLQRWTPFFWEQDRFGMLVPWLASPIRHPLANLLVQDFLDVACGLAAFFLLARYALRDASYPAVAAFGAATFLALAPAPYAFEYFIDTCYGVWFALGLGALILAESRPEGPASWGRLAAAGALMVLAHWVQCLAALILGPLVVCRALLLPRPARPAPAPAAPPTAPRAIPDRAFALAMRGARTEVGRSLLLLALGFGAGMVLMDRAPDHQSSFGGQDPSQWAGSWARLVGQTRAALDPPRWPLALALGAVAGLAIAPRAIPEARRRGRRASRAAVVLAVPGLVAGLFVGTRFWVVINLYKSRYLTPTVILLQAAMATLAVEPWFGALGPRARAWSYRLVAPALLAGAAAGYGLPSPAGVRADLDRRLGRLTPDILAARCTHVAGDYWAVWPAVFHANLALRDRGDPRMVWGITFRGGPAAARWRGMPREAIRVAIPLGDGRAEKWLEAFRFPRINEVGRRPTLRVVTPAPPPEPSRRPP